LRLLLDTHTFLWASADDRRLSDSARGLIEDPTNTVYLSVVSAWEIAIKFARGRIPELTASPESYVPARVSDYSMEILPMLMPHAFRVAHLPHVHRDPFDRMLIAQAQVEGLPVVTSDTNIARYDVQVIW